MCETVFRFEKFNHYVERRGPTTDEIDRLLKTQKPSDQEKKLIEHYRIVYKAGIALKKMMEEEPGVRVYFEVLRSKFGALS